MTGKRLKKIIQHMLLIFCVLKKKKYVQLIFPKSFWIVKKKNFINDSNRRKRRLAFSRSKKTFALLHGIT